jgi:hypothetical protein
MDRFGIGYVAALILLLLAVSLIWPPASGPGEASAPRVPTRHPLAESPARLASPADGPSAASTAAVFYAEGRSYRVLVGRDAEGRTWSAAFAVGD